VVLKLNQSLMQMEGLLTRLRMAKGRRIHNPNLLTPTIMALGDAIRQVERGECIQAKLNVIEDDLKMLSLA
jgi:hypothetical protein